MAELDTASPFRNAAFQRQRRAADSTASSIWPLPDEPRNATSNPPSSPIEKRTRTDRTSALAAISSEMTGCTSRVAIASRVGPDGRGVAVGFGCGVEVGCGRGVDVGRGVAVGCGMGVGRGVGVAVGDGLGVGVAVGAMVGRGTGVGPGLDGWRGSLPPSGWFGVVEPFGFSGALGFGLELLWPLGAESETSSGVVRDGADSCVEALLLASSGGWLSGARFSFGLVASDSLVGIEAGGVLSGVGTVVVACGCGDDDGLATGVAALGDAAGFVAARSWKLGTIGAAATRSGRVTVFDGDSWGVAPKVL